ncbi:MAG TPA: F0F1 ATP synthase subunit gamma [Dermatophilaceae bacterium]|jgi:F-type H+-transporting ATPase subunit gamma|nr:F0F1 ATP synthase subunit gamma [Dermatophilaceae bacterium]HOV01938.1 F0F1 ATP synthase subunit gamma [Dermatophilaceae bacterium]HPZ68278.1 F0F1 ATP synthase subunit gamma [Dermatophilaceae bacterium]HQD02001.1 F0F1 ATP synthase subunit gamma [Dermatophilaceae bacterium]HQG12400.1 F0F1 ATP synthase subunit gamma [Dermatophilaceae bacterium]
MGAQMRVYRQRIRSVQATKKITRAMELIAASRVVKARQRVVESGPYTHALTRALSALAEYSNEAHALITEKSEIKRAAVLVIAGDRGLSGGYNSSVIKESEQLVRKLQEEGKEVAVYLCGQRAINFYKFRHRDFVASWHGFSDAPQFDHAKEIADRLIADFSMDIDAGGNDEVHIVYTRFKSMVTQEPRVLRLVPLEVVEGETTAHPEVLPLYAFEPNVEAVLDALLPKYVTNRVYTCLLGSAASQLAAQQRAMKSATDNADALIKTYTRLANQARQAEITQEISEIVGGANALASA